MRCDDTTTILGRLQKNRVLSGQRRVESAVELDQGMNCGGRDGQHARAQNAVVVKII